MAVLARPSAREGSHRQPLRLRRGTRLNLVDVPLLLVVSLFWSYPFLVGDIDRLQDSAGRLHRRREPRSAAARAGKLQPGLADGRLRRLLPEYGGILAQLDLRRTAQVRVVRVRAGPLPLPWARPPLPHGRAHALRAGGGDHHPAVRARPEPGSIEHPARRDSRHVGGCRRPLRAALYEVLRGPPAGSLRRRSGEWGELRPDLPADAPAGAPGDRRAGHLPVHPQLERSTSPSSSPSASQVSRTWRSGCCTSRARTRWTGRASPPGC